MKQLCNVTHISRVTYCGPLFRTSIALVNIVWDFIVSILVHLVMSPAIICVLCSLCFPSYTVLCIDYWSSNGLLSLHSSFQNCLLTVSFLVARVLSSSSVSIALRFIVDNDVHSSRSHSFQYFLVLPRFSVTDLYHPCPNPHNKFF